MNRVELLHGLDGVEQLQHVLHADGREAAGEALLESFKGVGQPVGSKAACSAAWIRPLVS